MEIVTSSKKKISSPSSSSSSFFSTLRVFGSFGDNSIRRVWREQCFSLLEWFQQRSSLSSSSSSSTLPNAFGSSAIAVALLLLFGLPILLLTLYDRCATAALQRFVATYDHEISFISAVSFLALIAIATIRSLLFLFTLLYRGAIQYFYASSSQSSTNSTTAAATVTASRSKYHRKCHHYHHHQQQQDDEVIRYNNRNNGSYHCCFQNRILMCLGLLFIACEIPAWLQQMNDKAELIVGPDPKLQDVLRKVPAIVDGPNPPWYLTNRHVQFVPFMIQNLIHRYYRGGIPYQRIDVTVKDCLYKKKLSEDEDDDDDDLSNDHCDDDHIITDTVTLDVFPPFEKEDGSEKDDTPDYSVDRFNNSSPIILFTVGFRSDSQDIPGNSMVRKAYEAGFRSIVFNRRGHTFDRKLSAPRLNLFGDVDDLEKVYWYVKDRLLVGDDSDSTPFFLYGVSAGTSTSVGGLAKWDKRRRRREQQSMEIDKLSGGEVAKTRRVRRSPAFISSVGVSPGYDVSKVLTRERFLWPYNDIILRSSKETFVRRNERLLRSHNGTAVDEMLAATSLQEFVNAGVPFTGYGSVEEFYERTNPVRNILDITTPKLILNAVDDPCCVISNLYEISPYHKSNNHDEDFEKNEEKKESHPKTYAQLASEVQSNMVVVTRTGSHCPFLSSLSSSSTKSSSFSLLPSFLTNDPLTGGYMLSSWSDEVAIEYFKATLEIYNDRRYLK